MIFNFITRRIYEENYVKPIGLCVLSFQCFANSIYELNGKFYVTPGSVYVASDAIYINVDGNFISVESIASDANGIYIQDLARDTIYYCLKCKKCHPRGKCEQ